MLRKVKTKDSEHYGLAKVDANLRLCEVLSSTMINYLFACQHGPFVASLAAIIDVGKNADKCHNK